MTEAITFRWNLPRAAERRYRHRCAYRSAASPRLPRPAIRELSDLSSPITAGSRIGEGFISYRPPRDA